MRKGGTIFGWCRWHWQNLDTDRDEEFEGYREVARGNGWRYGRAWFYPGPTAARRHRRLMRRFEAAFARGEISASPFASVLVPMPSNDDDVRDLQRSQAHKLREAGQSVQVIPFDAERAAPRERRCLELDWSFFRKTSMTALKLETGGGDHDVQLHVGLWRVFSLFASWAFGTWRPREQRQWGISWHEQILWISRGEDAWDGMPLAIHAVDWLLGKRTYTSTDLRTRNVRMMMDEGWYDVRVRLTYDVWMRARWPWPLVARRARVDVLGSAGIPVPGNPDSDFYAGDDAIYSMTCTARDEREAVEALRESIIRDRRRHGGRAWTASLIEQVRG